MIRISLLTGSALLALSSIAQAQDADLLVFDYSGYELPQYHKAYIDAHGASPSFAFFADEDEAFQKLASGFRADVAHICAGSVTKWQESGMIVPWDTGRLAYFDDLNTDLVGASVTGAGDFYFLPTDYGSTALTYLPGEVDAEAAKSLQIFADPAYAGRVSLPDNVDDTFALAYLATGVTDWSNVSDAEFEAATDWLRAVHPNLRTYWTDAAELAQLMATGEVVLSWAWNETPPTMLEEGRPVVFERSTVEGSSLWVCGYVKLKDGTGVEAKAYDYVNAVLGPDTTDALMEDGFGQANAANMAKYSEDELKAAGLETISVPILAQLPMSDALRARQAEAFEMIKAGF